MEKPTKSKSMFLKFLPSFKNPSLPSFKNPSLSPEKRPDLKIHAGKILSISIIPAESRRKPTNLITFEVQEPTSPKVSCMGQIKPKKMKKETKQASRPKDLKPVAVHVEAKKPDTTVLRDILYSGAISQGRKSDVSADRSTLLDRAASLSQMRRFASGRDAITSFDWEAMAFPVDAGLGDYLSDVESEGREREAIVPFPAPITVGGGGLVMVQRKEVNLWKRRTMAQPRPLQVNNTPLRLR